MWPANPLTPLYRHIPTPPRGYLGGAFAVSKARWADRIAELFELLGTDLLRVAAATERRGGRVRATVVGHSIGGALASATALALADAFPAWEIAACTFAAAPFAEAEELRARLASLSNVAAWVTLANGEEYFRDPRVFSGRDFSGGLENWFSVLAAGGPGGDGGSGGGGGSGASADNGGRLRVVRARGSDLGSGDVCKPAGPLRGALLLLETTPDVITRRVLGTLPAAALATEPQLPVVVARGEATTPLLETHPVPYESVRRCSDSSTTSDSSSDFGSLLDPAEAKSAGGKDSSLGSLASTLTASADEEGSDWALVQEKRSQTKAAAASVLAQAAEEVAAARLAAAAAEGKKHSVSATPSAAAAAAAPSQERTTAAPALAALLKDLGPSSHRAFQIGPNTYTLV